jgi:hypothetical protein
MENPIVVKIPGLIAFAVHEGINELRQLNLATTIYGKINSDRFYIESLMRVLRFYRWLMVFGLSLCVRH